MYITHPSLATSVNDIKVIRHAKDELQLLEEIGSDYDFVKNLVETHDRMTHIFVDSGFIFSRICALEVTVQMPLSLVMSNI